MFRYLPRRAWRAALAGTGQPLTATVWRLTVRAEQERGGAADGWLAVWKTAVSPS